MTTAKKVPAKKVPAKKVIKKAAVVVPVPIGRINLLPNNQSGITIIRKLVTRMAKDYCKYNRLIIKETIPLTIIINPAYSMYGAGLTYRTRIGSKTECLLFIDPKDFKDWQIDEILCHELIHYLQFITKRHFKNEADQSNPLDMDQDAYRFSPSEVEAHGLMGHFCKKYLHKDSKDYIEYPKKKVK